MTMVGPWDRALLCGLLTLARPDLFGGVLIRSAQSPTLQQWLAALEAMNPVPSPAHTKPP